GLAGAIAQRVVLLPQHLVSQNGRGDVGQSQGDGRGVGACARAGGGMIRRVETFRCAACGRSGARRTPEQRLCTDRCRAYAEAQKPLSAEDGHPDSPSPPKANCLAMVSLAGSDDADDWSGTRITKSQSSIA